MAGNFNSGNRSGGKSITEIIQRSAKKAMKQGDAGLPGKRALDQLLGDLMQNDVAAFLKAVAPYVPKEVIIDQSISITHALEEAKHRIINHIPVIDQSLTHDVALTLPPCQQSAPCDALSVEGEGDGGVGAGLVRGSSS
jgi:hypothetical protein